MGNKSVLIIGRGAGVWDEVAAAKKLFTPDLTVAINIAGRDYPHAFDHWVTYHPEQYPGWITTRQEAGYPGGMTLWTAIFEGHHLGSHLKLPLQYVACDGGSSGYLAVVLSEGPLRGDRIVLCGIPLTDTPRYDDVRPWEEVEPYRKTWIEALPRLKTKVRSMSGWTREQLGAPDETWLHQ